MDDPLVLRSMREGGPSFGVWPTEQKPEEPIICPRTEKVIDEYDLCACDFCDAKLCKDCFSAAEEVGGGLNIEGSNLNACYDCASEQPELVRVDVLVNLSARIVRTGDSNDLKHLMLVRRKYKEAPK